MIVSMPILPDCSRPGCRGAVVVDTESYGDPVERCVKCDAAWPLIPVLPQRSLIRALALRVKEMHRRGEL